MKEVRIHGRGGQGSLVLAQFMAIAALEDDKFGLAFPFLGGGGERRGKPIMAFCRLDDKPVRLRCRSYQHDYVIVQDPTIVAEVDVAEGVKPGGTVLINTDQDPTELGLESADYTTLCISADDLARRILGRPIINTVLLGAFAGLTGDLSLEACLNAVQSKFPGELGQKNAQVVRESYAMLKEGGL